MYIEPRNIRKDGWTNTLGGVDSGRSANLLLKNQIAFAVNASLRGGYVENRPAFVKPALSFSGDDIPDWWANNEAQGAGYFAPVDKNPLIVLSVGGRLFKIDVLNGFETADITPKGQTESSTSFITPPIGSTVTVTVTNADRVRTDMPVTIGDGDYTVVSKANNILTLRNETATAGVSIANPSPLLWLDPNPKNRGQVWMEQADKWLVIQDGQSAAITYDGSDIKRALPGNGVPTGTAMVFNEEIGRLCVALPTNEVAVGDIDNVISFTETGYLHEGGKFKIPRKYGKITGANMLANQDRANGQGAMLFHTEGGITAFNLPAARDSWKSLSYPVQINMPIKGSTNHSSIVNVNGDVFYRGRDGLRSFALTRQEFSQWGNTPISRELRRILDTDDPKLLKFSSSVLFDNRVLFTVSPRLTRYSAYHEGLGVLDFEGVSAMGERSRPRYDGVWTGIKPTHLVVGDFGGEERCFAFSRNEAGGVELWEILRTGDFDGDDGRIEWWMEGRAMDFGNPMEMKRLESFEMWIDRVFGEVSFDLKYRADQYPCWFDWDTKNVCQKNKDCRANIGECITVKSYRQGYRSRQAFGQPPDTDENVDNKPSRNGYMFELRVACTGRARIKWGLAKATAIPEAVNPEVEETEAAIET